MTIEVTFDKAARCFVGTDPESGATSAGMSWQAAIAATLSAVAMYSALDRCPCDFCSGRKNWNDNWCVRCADVRMQPPKCWENLDVCDKCDAEVRAEVSP